MTSPVTVSTHNGVLIVSCDSPPVNALGAGVRAGLLEGLTLGLDDPGVEAIIFACAGRTFFAGADIAEFGKPMKTPSLSDLVVCIDNAHKPVIAAIHGTALGGGCELALACHYRVATRSAKIGLPEVRLGLVPGAGGTQRLPRLVGIAMALEMAALGEPMSAARAKDIGLVDAVTADGALVEHALGLARTVARQRPLPRVSEQRVVPDPEAIAQFRHTHARRIAGLHASTMAITCIEKAAELPFAEGLAFERATFMRLMADPRSAAQRHVFFAERQAARIDGIGSDIAARSVERVGIIGAGTMGSGIAINFLSAGLAVTLLETSADALKRGQEQIANTFSSNVAKGRMTARQAEQALALLDVKLDFDALGACDLVIEAVFENMNIKKDIFARLDHVAREGAILASNTSYLDLDEIAATTSRPSDVVGLHFFSPAHIMKLLEVVRGNCTAPDVLVTAMALARRIGKVAVVAGVTPGFIGNRLLRCRQNEAMNLLLEGATPEQIDCVHRNFGMPMGPFQMTDLAGVDIGWHRDPARVETIREALCAEGRWGQKTGAGFYDYDERRKPHPSPRVAEILQEFRKKRKSSERAISDDEILARTLFPMVNEGALLLLEGKAQRASDIDVAWVYGYGWPAWRGGPMFWAREQGFEKIAAALEMYGFVVAPNLRDVLETP
ncbi:3-hydroxyacyl-CoA dehydrogenase NAD-binding domain-containing protein [Novosphingobium sp. PP1Y]|uniref:3-hydroxyacyl-CoA dehydrogenase NAD-binding domain-containing protein n=1 Tax=Novosphingobium sp. PP1Y TaxID=702113 RepID=UPI00020EFA00|nr:3-hydroxyacyl-CoA dehydrogenase NAD-binding domain-containing protein [Novosphingobium sp. PP1Y]CCA90694.1 3-hydroxyacyl-CoA dehydrogenase, NAD-binding [Novosphingobium sp. PP1Y]